MNVDVASRRRVTRNLLVTIVFDDVMESENTSVSDDLTQRTRLMLEVCSVRRKVPKILIALDRKIQHAELKKLILTDYSVKEVDDQLKKYVQRTCPEENRTIPSLSETLCSVKRATAEVEETDAVLKTRVKSEVDISLLVKKVHYIVQHQHHCKAAQIQLERENPLITQARREGSEIIEKARKENTAKTESSKEERDIVKETNAENDIPMQE